MWREKTQINKIRNEKEEITTKQQKCKESTLRTYIPINWETLKKWTNF
jgi:hypothetical protein